MKAFPAIAPDQVTDGIYFGLPADVYHATPHVGSSNAKLLYSSPPDYWFESHMNPLREPEKKSFALSFGDALHDRILYGEESFKKSFEPTEGETEAGDVSADGAKKWVAEHGGTPAKTKDENLRIAREEYGVKLLGVKAFNKVMVAASMILKNPHLTQAFSGGWPEVSIFWHENGVPCKARLDYWKRRTIVDLKSFRSKERITSLDRWVLQDLFNYRYDIQRAHYGNGHAAAGALVEEGKVFSIGGAPAPTEAWLKDATKEPADWAFVFYKADGMPIAKSYQMPVGSPGHESGKAAVRLAMDNYRDNLALFGTDAWVVLDEPFTISEEDMPKWL
jgi:hypothetical protein